MGITVEKEFIQANDLVRDSFALARMIYDSGYRPEVVLVLWRGGTPVGVVVHEYLRYKGVETYHAAVKAESYTGIEQRQEPVVEHLDAVLRGIPASARVLVIDDIFDTGCTIRKVLDLLAPRTTNVKIATLYLKEGKNLTGLAPDFVLRRTDRWIVFPHELMGLTEAELRRKEVF